jgi:hypothetical protein
MNESELYELLYLIELSEEKGLNEEEGCRFIYLKEKMEQDDFDDFLCASIGLL